jgi:hypothetical protein
MVGRRTVKAGGNHVVERNKQRAGRMPYQDRHRHGGYGLHGRHAHPHNRTIVTVVALLFGRTAGHVRGHRRHAGHFGDGQCACSHWRHQWCSNEPGDHKDRKQTTDESAYIHDPTSHRPRNLTSRSHFTYSPARRFLHLWALRSPRWATDCIILDWGTRHRTVRAENAAVPGKWLKPLSAAFTVIEKLACISRHRFQGLMSAFRTGQDGLELHDRIPGCR